MQQVPADRDRSVPWAGRRGSRRSSVRSRAGPPVVEDSSAVECSLRRLEAHRDQAFDRIGGLLDIHSEVLALNRTVRVEYEIVDRLPTRRAADADPHAVIVTGPERLANRTEPVVAVVAATELDAQGTEIDVEFVVDGDDVGRLDAIETRDLRHRAARFVHVGPRTAQDDTLPARGADLSFDDVGATRLMSLP